MHLIRQNPRLLQIDFRLYHLYIIFVVFDNIGTRDQRADNEYIQRCENSVKKR